MTNTTAAPIAFDTPVVAETDIFGNGPVAGVVSGRNWFFDRVQSYNVKYRGADGFMVETVCPADKVSVAG